MSFTRESKHNSAYCASAIVFDVVDSVACMSNSATHTLRDNVRIFMDQRGWSQHVLAAKSGVAQTTIGNILRYRDAQDKHPGTDTVECLATAFGMPAWKLLAPPNTFVAGVAEPEPLDVELLATALAEANDRWRAHHLVPTFDELAAFAARMYSEVQTGIPLRRAATKVAQQLDQIRSGTFLASPLDSSGEGSKHGQGHQGKSGRSKARTR